MKNALLLFFFIAISGSVSTAQQQVGLHAGQYSNISYRIFNTDEHATEIMLADRYNGFHLAYYTENFRPLENKWSGDVFLYTGFGAHAGFCSAKKDYYEYDDSDDRFYRWGPLAGAGFMAGVEYRFSSLPLTAGIDYNPFAEISVARIFSMNLWNFGAHVRYSFK